MGNIKYNGEVKCPNCGYPIYGFPALSRKDDKTEICSNCGIAEAMSIYQNYIYSNNENKTCN